MRELWLNDYQTYQGQVYKEFKYVICVDHLQLKHLLEDFHPQSYILGKNKKWEADVYGINSDIAIVMGYKPFGNCIPDPELCTLCNVTARTALDSEVTRNLLIKFLNYAIKLKDCNDVTVTRSENVLRKYIQLVQATTDGVDFIKMLRDEKKQIKARLKESDCIGEERLKLQNNLNSLLGGLFTETEEEKRRKEKRLRKNYIKRLKKKYSK